MATLQRMIVIAIAVAVTVWTASLLLIFRWFGAFIDRNLDRNMTGREESYAANQAAMVELARVLVEGFEKVVNPAPVVSDLIPQGQGERSGTSGYEDVDSFPDWLADPTDLTEPDPTWFDRPLVASVPADFDITQEMSRVNGAFAVTPGVDMTGETVE